MGKDTRDLPTWVALELTRQGETKIEEGTLESSLRKSLGVEEDFPVFIPAATFLKNGKLVTIHLMQGYAFVGSSLDEADYFRLERKSYVNQVLSQENAIGMKVLTVLPDKEVKSLKLKLRTFLAAGVSVGTTVRVVEGLYENLEGKVLAVEENDADISFSLRSLQAIVLLPKLFLETVEEVEYSEPEIELVPDEESSASTFELDDILQTEPLPTERPTASYFYDAVLVALGEYTNFKPETGIEALEVQDRILQIVGIDPERSPWPLKGRQGLYRRVHYAFRNQREGYTGQSREIYTMQIRKGVWGLSPEGVERAKTLAKTIM